MLSFAIILFSLLSFLVSQVPVRRYGKNRHRKRLTGSEIARSLLDSYGCPDRAVGIEPRNIFYTDWKPLFLPRGDYYGSTLGNLAAAARKAYLFARGQGPGRTWLRAGIAGEDLWMSIFWLLYAPSWIFAMPDVRSVLSSMLMMIFLFRVFEVLTQWEASREVTGWFKRHRDFEVDETVQIKRLLRGMRLLPVAHLCMAPGFLLIRFLKDRRQESERRRV